MQPRFEKLTEFAYFNVDLREFTSTLVPFDPLVAVQTLGGCECEETEDQAVPE